MKKTNTPVRKKTASESKLPTTTAVKPTTKSTELKRATPNKHPLRRLWLRRVGITAGALIAVWILGMYIFGLIYQHQHRNDQVRMGTSFSIDAARDLGVDWQANFTALLDDMHMKHFRLMSYWENSEKQPGSYNFEDLDWQMNEVAKRGATVSLAIGLRQPRWPECHQPAWARQLEVTNKSAWNQSIETYIQTVVDRYKNHPALENWHLENEYFNRNFGDCRDFSVDRLKAELNLVKRHDPKHQVIVTLADQLGFPFFGPYPDLYGTSLYKGNYVKFYGYFPYPIPSQFYSAKAYFVKLLHGKEMFIHELQLEPWGPKPTKEMSVKDQDHYMDTKRMQENLDFAKQTGMKKMNLWGAEWWYWRKTKLNDPRPWNLVKDELAKHPY